MTHYTFLPTGASTLISRLVEDNGWNTPAPGGGSRPELVLLRRADGAASGTQRDNFISVAELSAFLRNPTRGDLLTGAHIAELRGQFVDTLGGRGISVLGLHKRWQREAADRLDLNGDGHLAETELDASLSLALDRQRHPIANEALNRLSRLPFIVSDQVVSHVLSAISDVTREPL